MICKVVVGCEMVALRDEVLGDLSVTCVVGTNWDPDWDGLEAPFVLYTISGAYILRYDV